MPTLPPHCATGREGPVPPPVPGSGEGQCSCHHVQARSLRRGAVTPVRAESRGGFAIIWRARSPENRDNQGRKLKIRAAEGPGARERHGRFPEIWNSAAVAFVSQKPLIFFPLLMKMSRHSSDKFYPSQPLLTHPCWGDKLKTHETIKRRLKA